jgi:hypothetical protein
MPSRFLDGDRTGTCPGVPRNGGTGTCFKGERRDRYLFQIEYEQLYNKEVKECLGKLENHQELVYIT